MKKVRIETIGCKVNFAESEKLKEIFKNNEYLIANNDETPDVILVNTCTVTSKAERDSRKMIRRLKRENPNAKVIAAGCMVEFDEEKSKKVSQADILLGQQEKYNAPQILRNIEFGKINYPQINKSKQFLFESAASSDPENRSRGFLKIQDGCDYYCTYCAVAYSRGNSRSMNFNEIIPELKKIREKGFREIVISGINLGTYNNNSKNFSDVIELIANSNLDARIRISSIEPNLLTDKVIQIVKSSPKFCPHFHIPLQSGSNEILKLMKRRYSTEYFRELIDKIKMAMPDSSIGIDLITGFPGETDELFEETVNFISDLPVTYLHVFTYSERTGTPAVNLPNKVAESEKKRRTQRLLELSELKKQDFYKSQLGKYFDVIPEHKKTQDFSYGWTENYIRTKFISNDYFIDIIKVKTISIDDNGIVFSEIKNI